MSPTKLDPEPTLDLPRRRVLLIIGALMLGTFLAVPVTAMLRVLKLHFAPAPTDAETRSEEAASTRLRRI